MGTISGTLEYVFTLLKRPSTHSYCRAYPNACVVWVDAHADINTIETTDSG